MEISFPQGLWYANDKGGLDPLSVDVKVEIRKQGTPDWQNISMQAAGTALGAFGGRWSRGKWVAGVGDNFWYEDLAGSSDFYEHYDGELYIFDLPAGGRETYYWRWVDAATEELASSLHEYWTVRGNKNSRIAKTFFAAHFDPGRYEVRVTNLSDDYSDTRHSDDLYLATVREVRTADFQYPRHVLVGLRALATDQLSGSLRFSCLAEGALVRVWSGAAWSVAYSDNPAWVVWDILTQPVFNDDLTVNRHDGVDPARMDLVKFKEWADYCDGLVPDGKGGTEKRITFNGGFDAEMTMWEAALKVCEIGRAVLVWQGVHLTLAIDKPDTPKQLFCVGNVEQDSFAVDYLPQAERAAEIEADFVNAELDYQRDKLSVFNQAMKGKTNRVNLNLFGVVKPSEVWRHLTYRLAMNQHILRTARLAADIDAIACTIGDVVSVQHDVPRWGDAGGRIVAATANTVTLDKEVTIEAGKSYAVMVQLSTDDSRQERGIADPPGAYTTLTLSAPWTVVPQKYDNYAFGEVAKTTKPFRVTGIEPTSEFKHTLLLAEYNESIYNADLGLPVLPTPNYSSLERFPKVSEIVLSERVEKRADGTLDDFLVVSWKSPVANFKAAEIWFDIGGGWTYAGESFTGHFEFPCRENLVYTVAARTINGLGQKQPLQAAPTEQRLTRGKDIEPAAVTGFGVELVRGQMRFYWQAVPEPDVIGYEIQIADGEWDDPGNKTIVSDYAGTSYPWTPDRTGTIRALIKAKDSTGHYSTDAAALEYVVTAPGAVTDLRQKAIDNIVEIKWQPGTVGTFPIAYYNAYRGTDYATAEYLYRKYVTGDLRSEDMAGTFKYWITAVDEAGLESAPAGIYAKVDQPPDYVLHDQRDLDWLACALVNAVIEDGELVLPVNASETFEQHFTNQGIATPQQQVDAGKPLFIQPGPGSASLEEVIDYGAILPAVKVTLTVTRQTMAGTVTVTPTLWSSTDGAAWTLLGNVYEAVAQNFRYQKVKLDFATADNGVMRVQQATLKLDVKERTHVTTVNVTDLVGDGTETTFASLGIAPVDVRGITATAPYTGDPAKDPIDARVNIADVPYPPSFKTLAWDRSLNRTAVNNVVVNIRYV